MTTPRGTVKKLTVAVGLMFGGVLALVLFLSRAATIVTSTDDAITGDYSPSVVALDSVLADLRNLQRLLGERAHRATISPGEEAEISTARGEFEEDAATYLALPIDPGEASLIQAVGGSVERLNKTLDRLLAAAPGTSAADPNLSKDFESARLALDADIMRATDFNADLSIRAASQSKRVASTLIPTAAVLGFASVLTAAAVIWLAYRSVIRAEALASASRQALERRADELEQFAGRVAHDLLSPLTSVGLAIEIVRRDASPAKPRTEAALARASVTLERVRRIVSDLLEFARAGAAAPPGVRTEVDEIVHEVAEEFIPIAQEANAELSVEQTPLSLVRCSSGVLTSLLSNLVQNAIKYLGDARERRVVIRARDLGAEVRLEVEDTGPGIPQFDQSRLFEPYARGHDAKVPGLGIGLATVRKLAEAHGGHAGVLSEPGHGALFWVTLPVAH